MTERTAKIALATGKAVAIVLAVALVCAFGFGILASYQ
jgi:hypothetical protein